MWRAWSPRRLRAETVDRLLAAAAGDLQAAAAIAAIERQARDGLTELNELVREMRPAGDTGPTCRRSRDLVTSPA